eukprot:SAG22_NODE_978_length_6192_cov_2.764320_3_plen_216_part_00
MGGLFSRDRPTRRVSAAFADGSISKNSFYQQAPAGPDGTYFGINDPTVCSRFGSVFQASAPTRFDSTTGAPRDDSSIVLVIVIYTLMNGSTLNLMPQMYYEAGLVVSLCCTLLIGFISYFTCSLIVRMGGHSEEFWDFADCVAVHFEDVSGRRSVGAVGRSVTLGGARDIPGPPPPCRRCCCCKSPRRRRRPLPRASLLVWRLRLQWPAASPPSC